MKAHIDHDVMRDRVRVWLYSDGPQGRAVLAADLDTMVPIEDGEVMPGPTLDLHPRVADALAAALHGRRAPSEATTRHLDDALAVRDRLLALVEASVPPARKEQS